ncbi:glutamine--fructose-6-phosphate transaminase (isomerizing) [Halanaeroarchaeum sulfurireducens]|uniref:Glutamine--fructose-6-phosphate aminotransferase [isomerizing] n=1 Tax=Halanaeroarchaeum sulfurireducens TaxID=1604004 RepID=A0A0F7P898_9EURY|nr:glutamine--fructose-6-phosphate transaminase (isomerizing) [Halanaeroarchaeum sulfurireducens]AKH97381.1 glucosamine--fructose-6-phosphate aminotransferase [Halanaeroarchaeum sulfurireducens]ALG81783.1 glucosamine--fructose-6-phosphate aminotransferase [Halanaeroarchaeum sulfurireducens]
MCGITGYVGGRDGLPILAASLKNLEYRGYDSAGIAIANAGVEVYKQEGEIDDLDLPAASDATLGIGHTRWSTHGEPNDANAHPHTDCSGDIAVVHNGIIDNYETLKADLMDRHEFTSETDTEVVAHLLEDELDASTHLRAALEAVVAQLEGSFALAAITADEEGIVAARQDSPLVVGRSDGETFLASDVPAFIEHTRDVVYLDDGDIAWLTDETVSIWNDGEPVQRDTDHVDWEADAAEKGGYEHYMLKEIHEQPQALRQALSGRVDEVAGEVSIEHSLSAEYLNSLDEIQFVAAGTSYHAGVFASRLFESLADVRVTTHVASEYEFTGGRDPWRTLTIAVTQSGETADTLSAIRAAKSGGAKTLAVTNTVGSTVTRETDDTILIQAGPEIGVAATKTFVSQVATLTMLAVQFGRTRNALGRSEARDLLENVRGLPGAIQRVLDREDTIATQAVEYADSEAFFFIGRHLGHAVALEAALKLKEISYDHAEGFAAGELKHGPLALVTDEATVLSVLTEGARPEETVHNVKEVDSRRANTIGVTSQGNFENVLDAAFEIPSLGRMEPLVANVYFQLFAYHVADHKGRPIDKPRNLAKSVTVQ